MLLYKEVYRWMYFLQDCSGNSAASFFPVKTMAVFLQCRFNHAWLQMEKYMSWVKTSAVKRLKYLIVINRIYVIVNSKLIAINRTFLSILNVPSFIYFHHFIFILMPLSTWKSGLACFMQMFYFIENKHCQTGRHNIKI